MVNIVLITIDGVRRKEIFEGPDVEIISKLRIKEKFNKKYNQSIEELLPCIHKKLIPASEIYKNVIVENKILLSYSGYNDILTGKSDSNIKDNNEGENPNKTFQELLIEKKKVKKEKVLICTAWSKFIDIFSYNRSNLKPENWINKTKYRKLSYKRKFNFNRYKFKKFNLSKHVYDIQHDLDVYRHFKTNLLKRNPSLMFLGLGLTDEWADDNNYIQYWNHLILADHIIEDLINTLQKINKYKNNTIFIITTDHGRGNNYKTWKQHNSDIYGSDESWAIIYGPNIKPKNITKKLKNTFIYHKIMDYFTN
jgi:hypothetical protein